MPSAEEGVGDRLVVKAFIVDRYRKKGSLR
jgi:hypothetical protein